MELLDDEISKKIIGLSSFKKYKEKLYNDLLINGSSFLVCLAGILYTINSTWDSFLFVVSATSFGIIAGLLLFSAICIRVLIITKKVIQDLLDGKITIEKDVFLGILRDKNGPNRDLCFYLLKEKGKIDAPVITNHHTININDLVYIISTNKNKYILEVIPVSKMETNGQTS